MEFINDTDTLRKHDLRDITVSLPHIKRDKLHIHALLHRDIEKVIRKITFASGRKDIDDLLIGIVKENADIITVTAFEGISLIKAKTFRKPASKRLDMSIKDISNRGSGHMMLGGDITESEFRLFQFYEDIIYGRSGDPGITGSERIHLIEGFGADGTNITSGSVMNRAFSRIENSVIDLLQLIAFDLGSEGVANRAALFPDIEFKINKQGAILVGDTDVLDIGMVETESSKKILQLKRRWRKGISRQGNHQLSMRKINKRG